MYGSQFSFKLGQCVTLLTFHLLAWAELDILLQKVKIMISQKLNYERVKPIPDSHSHSTRYCAYCQREQKDEEFYAVLSSNIEIFRFFQRPRHGNSQSFFLCPECFEKLHDLSSDIESEGWTVLDPDSEEFKDLDSELKGEDGTWN